MRAGVSTSNGERGRARRAAVRRRRSPAALVCIAALALLVSACAAGSGGQTTAAADQGKVLEPARSQLAQAAAAIRDGDRAAFTNALPVDGGAQDAALLRERVDDIYAALAPLPWTSLGFTVEPLAGRDGVYRVVGRGQLGEVGPADRLAVVRYLKLAAAPDGVAVTADVTPEDLRRRYLMALHDPVVLQRPGFVVLADRWARDRAREVADSAGRARIRLAALGLDTRPAVLVTIYGSAEDVRDALAVSLPSVRLRFFAHQPLRVSKQEAPVGDVGVMGPWLRDPGQSIDGVFVHELAHAYTASWFTGGRRKSALLQEGIAAAAEGVSVAPGLREEVQTGDNLWPLPESFGVDDVWDGGDMEAVGLGYEIGRSLVDYVDTHWGARHLEGFVKAVAAAEPTEAGMDAALGESLGVSWDRFYDGWRRFVLRGG
jgi:hypothetical protein